MLFHLLKVSLLSKSTILYVLNSIFAYIEDRLDNDLPAEGERLTGFMFLIQSLMLGSFAAILAAHRSEILDQKVSLQEETTGSYEAPRAVV